MQKIDKLGISNRFAHELFRIATAYTSQLKSSIKHQILCHHKYKIWCSSWW